MDRLPVGPQSETRVAVHRVTPQEAMRAIIEPAALLESAPSLTADDYENIEGLLAEAKEAIARFENEKLSEVNSAIHTSLYKKTRNDILLSWLEQLSDKHKPISLYGWRAGTPKMQEWQEHHSIVTDCKNGQFDTAAARLRTSSVRPARCACQCPQRATDERRP
jgi:DNA-binding GntR family transcriptional regulator